MSRKQRDAARDAAREFPPAQFAQNVRPCCDDCGGAVRWMPLRELVRDVPRDAVEDIAERVDTGYFTLDDESWLCGSCGKFGIFSDWFRS